nr:unnamed protein product [Callosobruchus analis]
MDSEKTAKQKYCHDEEEEHSTESAIFVVDSSELRSTVVDVLKLKDAWKQTLAVCIANTVVIQVGINLAFSAILLPQLDETKSSIRITKAEASWIVWQKEDLLDSEHSFSIAWLLHYTATNVWYIYIARIIAGFSGGKVDKHILYLYAKKKPL